MARKLRVQYEGAFYHVVNRGNYRRDVFESPDAAQAFVSVLEEATLAYGWKCHSYAVMRNHYHIVLETPQPNLVAGMHWLQGTLATRFNRFRSEHGHLFQGRYHAGLIEDCRILGHVVDYVHLNPVRAGIVPGNQASLFRWSSLGRFVRGSRFPGLTASDWLRCRQLEDTARGWEQYQKYLIELAGSLEQQKRLGWKEFSSGWALGSDSWRNGLAKDHAHRALDPGLEASSIRDLREARWTEQLRLTLAALSRKPDELVSTKKKGEPWKVAIALHLRSHFGVSCHWLSQQLHMGTPGSTRSLLSHARSQQNQQSSP
jgi:REP element-mobilizing transposase RayT